MLVLKRRIGERVTITCPTGEKVVITTLEGCDTKSARLGFEAPKHVAIHREEVQERVEEEQRAAS